MSELIEYGSESEAISKTLERLDARLSEYVEAEHRLKVENERLRAELKTVSEDHTGSLAYQRGQIDRLRAENERLRMALEEIRDMWPLTVYRVQKFVNVILARTAPKTEDACQPQD